MALRYPDIKNYFITKIEEKEYVKGDSLPTERELTEMFNVSRMTVRRALDELIQEGYAYRKKGSSVFVGNQKNLRSSKKMSLKNDDELKDKYGEIKTIVLSLEKIKADHLCRYYLELTKEDEVFLLKRLQSGTEEPLVYEQIYLPKKYFNDIDIHKCHQSMSVITQKYTKKYISNNNYQEVEAKISDKELSELLQIPLSYPVLQIINIAMLDNRPLYFGIDCFDSNKFKYTTKK